MSVSALSRLLAGVSAEGMRYRRASAAAAVALPAGAGQPFAALAIVTVEPLPCRLATHRLVELLKMPTCTGEARRVVLDQLGNRYHRTFATAWDFVAFAKEQNLDLDFKTPPKRP